MWDCGLRQLLCLSAALEAGGKSLVSSAKAVLESEGDELVVTLVWCPSCYRRGLALGAIYSRS